MKRFLVLSAFALLLGCSHGEQVRRQELDLQARKIAGLEKRIEEIQAQVRFLKEQLIDQIARNPGSRIDQTYSEEKPPAIMPDGQIIFLESDRPYAYIDLGRKHGLKRGNLFKVFKVLMGGRYKSKGVVRVIRVKEGFSQCSIFSTDDKAEPIAKGDYIWNQFFQRNSKKNFAFVGRFAPDAEHSKEELKLIIEQNGHLVMGAVGTHTDYVVLGDEPAKDPQWKRVTDFKVTQVSTKVLLEFFGKPEPHSEKASAK